jgi:ABC-type dipeptide/oligopeptide/nickel transport system permease subunit
MADKQRFAKMWGVYKQRTSAVIGLFVLVFMITAIILAPYISPYDPDAREFMPFSPPDAEHLLGTNDIGVDILSELIHAGRISLLVGFTAAGLILITGSIVGLISGYFGGMIDEILMRITDIIIILPRLPLMIVMAAYLGPGVWTIIFAYAIVGWPSLARQIRSQVLSVKEFSFIEAARATGAGNFQIMLSHILPNIQGLIIANGVMEVMFAILTEAGLSFLGLGDATQKSWGVMLYFAQIQGAFLRGAWWWIFPPGLCIAVISCCFNFIGTALNDLFSLKLGET